MFGPIKIYDVVPSSDELIELTNALREKAAMAVLNQSYGRQQPRVATPAPSFPPAAVAF